MCIGLLLALILASPAWAQSAWYRISWTANVAPFPGDLPGEFVGCGGMSGTLGDFLVTLGTPNNFGNLRPSVPATTTEFVDCVDGVTPTFPARNWDLQYTPGFGDFDLWVTPGATTLDPVDVELMATIFPTDGVSRYFQSTIPTPCGLSPLLTPAHWCVVALGDVFSGPFAGADIVAVQYNSAANTPFQRSLGEIEWIVALSPDSDGDGVPDPADICPGSDDNLDSDGDGAPDGCDACPLDELNDADGDGVCGNEDVCPIGDDLLDADGDGTPDACDVCAGGNDGADADGDGTPDFCDVCEGGDDSADADGDGTPDACDVCAGGNDGADADGDGTPDFCDVCAAGDDSADTDADGTPDACDICAGGDDSADADGDGTPDFCDVCAAGDDSADADADGTPDACDVCSEDADDDADGDGLCGDVDPCPADAENDADGDGVCGDVDSCPLDAANDADGDGLCESEDNCDLTANPDQMDNDGDAAGDACDPDDDNDNVDDVDDNCPFDPNADQADADGDGLGDACDDSTVVDSDGDGILDSVDACPDTAAGAAVDDDGCSIAQRCPCENAWKNHGAYVSCTAKTSEAFLAAGRVTEAEKDAIVSAAGQAACGRKSKE